MTTRIEQLRRQSLNAINCISSERAELLTDFYENRINHADAVVVQRAKAFAYILANKEIYVGHNELIVGERGPAPKATPTYPEITLHSLQDLQILDSRPKVSFKVSEAVKTIYRDRIIPFWTGKTMRDKIFNALDDQWKQAYEAGIFTEFQEQRAPGHTVADHKIYSKGLTGFIADIEASIQKLNFINDPEALDKRNQLSAMKISADALIHFANRHVEKLNELIKIEPNTKRKTELLQMAEVCTQVPARAPRNLHEALQYYWFVHLGVITELNPWDSFNPGRLDQHLFEFWQNDLENSGQSREQLIELLHAFWIKFNNHPAPPKIGVTAKESSTYTDFSLINLGGLKPDGSNAVNELSFVLLDVIEEMRLLQPSSMVQISKKNPDSFIKRALKIAKTGFGQPSIFNTDAIIQQLMRQGKTLEDARRGGASGCIETGAFGTESYILTGYFNLPKIAELALFGGTDPRIGKKIGADSQPADQMTTFDQFMQAFELQLNHFVEIKLKGNNIIESIYGKHLPAPFLSVFIDDCIASGKDYNLGGARYNTSYVQGVGMGSVSDMITALKYHVFDHKKFKIKELQQILIDNFENYDAFRAKLLYETPKYGNDDDYADLQAVKVFEMFYNAVNDKPTARGGRFRINLLPTTSHVYFGTMLIASPDGRKCAQPLSEGISPVQGADKNGPVAVLNSAAKIDQLRTGGTLLNQKFSPDFFKDETAIEKLKHLVRSYFRMDGHHIQFNVVSADTLRRAQKQPENYGDLIVRVAGYSDYFNDLSTELQNEIIKRTQHENF